MVWEEELEQWAQWVEQAIFLLLLQKAPLDPLQAAFQLELQVLEDLPLELLHNLEGGFEQVFDRVLVEFGLLGFGREGHAF